MYCPSINSESEDEENWEESESEADGDWIDMQMTDKGICNTPGPAIPDIPSESQEYKSAHSLFRWIVGFVIVLQAKHHIPNTAIDLLIKFFHVLFCILGTFSTFAGYLRRLFPPSLYLMRKHNFPDCSFIKFPVCRKCFKVYKSYDDCIEVIGSQRQSKHCDFVAFPNHPQLARRKKCDAVLLKTVHLRSGRKIFYPFKVYCYNGIKSTLQKLLLRPHFYESCSLWTKRTSTQGVLSDVYDGCIWKEFEQSSFFESKYAYGLMLNMDFFQPYTHTVYSVGVIYLTVMNLPRSIRYKLENIIIVGIIPGPREPSLGKIDSFLAPLVSELKDFWDGVVLNVHTPSGIIEQEVKCALMCISCDLPAGRKLLGFLSYNARLGCSRCLKEFTGPVGSQNYAGFNRSQWKVRSDKDHRDNVAKLKKCKTKSELSKREAELGCRNSILLI